MGLLTKTHDFRALLTGSELAKAEELYAIMPRQQSLVTIPVLFPSCATELALICYKEDYV